MDVVFVVELFLSAKTLLFQPLTNGQVVELVGSVGNEDGEHEDADGNEDVCA